MKQLIYLAFLCLFVPATAQVELPELKSCTDPETDLLPLQRIEALQGYHDGFVIPVPGVTDEQKADFFLDMLSSEFNVDFETIDLAEVASKETSWRKLLVFQQEILGLSIEGRKLWGKLNKKGGLVSFFANLEWDQQKLADAKDRVEALDPGDLVDFHYTIQEIDGEYYPVQGGPKNIGGPSGGASAFGSVEVTWPAGAPGCVKETEDVTINAVPLALGNNGAQFYLDGTYANTAEQFENDGPDFTYDCGGTGCSDPVIDKHETVNCYFFLNQTYHWLNNSFYAGIYSAVEEESVVFNPYNTGTLNDVVSVSSDGTELLFGGQCFDNNPLTDYGQDADYIVSAAFESFIKMNGESYPASDDGVGVGSAAYFTAIFMKNNEHEDTDNLIGNWAGIDLEPINNASSLDYQDVTSFSSKRLKSQVWATALTEIDAVIGSDLMAELLLASFQGFTDGTDATDQPEAAEILYGEAAMMHQDGIISTAQLCEIETILDSKYENLNIGAPTDHYIKDSFDGQCTWYDGGIQCTNGEDVGNEPNMETVHFWISPSITNCVDQGCGEHQNPQYEGNDPNFLSVVFHKRNCNWEDIQGKLRVYISVASTGHTWPIHWGEDFWGNEDPFTIDVPQVGPVVAGKRIADVELTSYIAQTDETRTYEIPWIPLNPQDFANHEDFNGAELHVCILARIVSPEDEMNSELFGGMYHNLKYNNNIAMKNMTVEYKSGLVGPPDPPKHLLLLRPGLQADIPAGAKTVELAFDFMTNDRIRDFNDFSNAGTVQIELSNKLLEVWGRNGTKGQGFQWMNENTIKITGPEFRMQNLDLKFEDLYALKVQFVPTRNFVPVTFALIQADTEGCIEGGEIYDMRLDEEGTGGDGKEGGARNAAIPAATINNTNSIQAFPNPASSEVTLRLEDPSGYSNLMLLDIYGRVLEVRDQPGTTEVFSVSQLPKGVYFIQATGKERNCTIKIAVD